MPNLRAKYGQIPPGDLGSGTPTSLTFLDGSGAWRALAASDLGSGTPDSSKFLRGDGTWNNTLAGPLILTSIRATDSSGISLQSNTGTVVAVVSPTNLQTDRLGGRSQRLGVGGGPGGGQGVCEVWSALSVASGVSFGSFPDPGPGGIYAQSRLRLGAASTVDAASSELVGTAQGLVLHSATGLSNRLQIAGVTNSNFGASFGTAADNRWAVGRFGVGAQADTMSGIAGDGNGYVHYNVPTSAYHNYTVAGIAKVRVGASFGSIGADRWALGPYAVGAASNTNPGIACDGSHLLHNVASGFAHYFSHAGNTTLHLLSGGPNFYTAPASDWQATFFSNNYYNTLNFKTTSSSPGGATTQAYILSGPNGLYLAGYGTIYFRPGGTDAGQLTVANGLTNINGLGFATGKGVSEQDVKSYANGGPNLANISLRQMRSSQGLFPMLLNSGSAVQTRVNSVAVPGGSVFAYNSTGSDASAFLGDSFIAVDTTKTYSMRAWAQNLTNNPDVYIGLHCYNSAGSSLGYVYCCANQVKPSVGGQWYQGYISGEGAPQTRFAAGTAYVRLVYLVGYGSPVGAWETRISPIEFVECPAQCGAFHNTTQSVANTTWTAASFNSEILDTSNLHDNSTNTDRVNVPRTGKYRITAQAEFAANATGYRQARVTVNGSALARSTKIVPNNGASLEAQASIEIYAVLTAGDIVRLEAYQDSGGSLDLTSNTRLYLLWISD